jgi:two-component sensor histidine kinase
VTNFAPHSSAMDARLLPRELDHRIRNELACAINLVSVAAIRAENSDVKSVLSDVSRFATNPVSSRASQRARSGLPAG